MLSLGQLRADRAPATPHLLRGAQRECPWCSGLHVSYNPRRSQPRKEVLQSDSASSSVHWDVHLISRSLQEDHAWEALLHAVKFSSSNCFKMKKVQVCTSA